MVYVPATAVGELANIAEANREQLEGAKDMKKGAKSVLPAADIDQVLRSRNGVINLFGRMLAEIDDAGVDGAVQVAHALTTHGTDVEIDYFAAVDDITAAWKDTAGSAHMGSTEYSAGVFYRYATIDLDDLLRNIGGDVPSARELAAAFIEAFVLSLPEAKKTATAPHTIPDLVHLTVRGDRPLSYAAAFEQPVTADRSGGFRRTLPRSPGTLRAGRREAAGRPRPGQGGLGQPGDQGPGRARRAGRVLHRPHRGRRHRRARRGQPGVTSARTPGQEPAGILLHLSGPLQSWGTHSAFNEHDTARFPTRSGIIGLLASSLGRRRGDPVDDLAHLSLTTRTDRPGVLLRDLHTVGGGMTRGKRHRHHSRGEETTSHHGHVALPPHVSRQRRLHRRSHR